MSSKGGSTKQSTQQNIAAYLESAARDNLNQAKIAGQIGYVPYYGPEVAGLSPQQTQSMQNTFNAQQAFGMAPQGAQFSTGLPEVQQFAGGVSGYSSGGLFDQALEELRARQPDIAAQYDKFYSNRG
jgi:hypothetical protein